MDINLTSPWETCFAPGQRVVMSMVFNTDKIFDYCPRCHSVDNREDLSALNDEDIQW